MAAASGSEQQGGEAEGHILLLGASLRQGCALPVIRLSILSHRKKNLTATQKVVFQPNNKIHTIQPHILRIPLSRVNIQHPPLTKDTILVRRSHVLLTVVSWLEKPCTGVYSIAYQQFRIDSSLHLVNQIDHCFFEFVVCPCLPSSGINRWTRIRAPHILVTWKTIVQENTIIPVPLYVVFQPVCYPRLVIGVARVNNPVAMPHRAVNRITISIPQNPTIIHKHTILWRGLIDCSYVSVEKADDIRVRRMNLTNLPPHLIMIHIHISILSKILNRETCIVIQHAFNRKIAIACLTARFPDHS